MTDSLRKIRHRTDLGGSSGNIVELVGRYRVRDISPHKIVIQRPDGSTTTVQHDCVVILDDDTTVQLGSRPDAEHVLDGVTVRAIGRLEASPPRRHPGRAQPDGAPTLFDVQTVERA